jgi:hypothetical protein
MEHNSGFQIFKCFRHVLGMILTPVSQPDIEKAERYFHDLKNALENPRGLPSLDDFQHHCQTAIYCAERLASLPRYFWDSMKVDGLIATEGGKLPVSGEVRDYGRMGNILRAAVSSVNTLRAYFEGIIEGRHSGSQFVFAYDFAEELRRYIKTYDDLHRCGFV